MKRIFTLLLALCLLLSGCGGLGGATDVPGTAAPATESTAAPTTEPTVEPTRSPTTVPTEPPVLYRHPLTGETLEAPYTGRPTAVVINNLKKCLPQHGISQASMIYEVETEGGITRLLAIFPDVSQVAEIGPVRSLRTFFTSIAASYDIPTVHCGGSVKGLRGMHSISAKLKDWEHVDEQYNGEFFYRDQARKQQGYAREHTLFTTGELLTQALVKKELNTVYETPQDYGLQFSDAVALAGESANTVKVTFTGKKTTSFTYDPETGLYKASQYKKDHIDGSTGEVMTYRNLIVLHSGLKKEHDGYYTRSYYNLIGDGKGYFICNGQMVHILWSRKTVNDPFVYTLEDGTPLTLGVGKSYVAIVGLKSPAGVECE